MNEAISKLKEQMQILDELKVQRAELQQKQAVEIGKLDNAINQTWTKVSSLVSIIWKKWMEYQDTVLILRTCHLIVIVGLEILLQGEFSDQQTRGNPRL